MKYSLPVFLYLVFGFFWSTSYAQINLVRNASFEEVNAANLLCNFYQVAESFDRAILHWTVPSRGTSDIYHMSLDNRCTLHPLSTSASNLGNRAPRTGQSMVGLLMYVPDSQREYIQGELLEPLQAGHEYEISFYVSLARKSQYASNNFGIKFFNAPYFQNSTGVIEVTPDAHDTTVIDHRMGWIRVVLSYTPPTTGATHFVVGNFFTNEETLVVQDPTAEDTRIRAYYYLDDMSIVSKTPTFDPIASICQGGELSLPAESKEGYAGSWSPAPNTRETTTYTFTATDPTVQATSLTVEVIPPYLEAIFDLPLQICAGDSVELPLSSAQGYAGTWSPALNSETTTTYVFTPVDGHCVLPYSTTIEVTPKIVPQFALPAFVCEGMILELPTTSTNGIEGTWSPAFNAKETTVYHFTPLEIHCATSVSVEIAVKHPKRPVLAYYCLKDNLYVEAQAESFTPLTQFQWTINQIPVEEDASRLNLSTYRHLLQEQSNVIALTATDENGCQATTTLALVDAKSLCFIPKGISPQGDGLNDFFDLENFGGVSLIIFNRYGRTVYQQSEYRKEWKGQSNGGHDLPSGTYFYAITTAQGEVFTGWVQLMREF